MKIIGMNSSQRGLSLVELMIAMLLGLFLIGGLLQIFISSRQTYRMQEGLSRLQENGRFAIDFISRDIRMAGFLGCNSQAAITNKLNMPTPPTDFIYDFNTVIEGFEAISATAWTPAINAAITSPLGGSDVITIRRADAQGFAVTAYTNADLTLDTSTSTSTIKPILTASNANLTASSDNLKTAGFLNSSGGNNCAIAVISGCVVGDVATVFQVSAITGSVLAHGTGVCSPGNDASSNWSPTYVGGQVFPINTISYYIRTNSIGQPSLYYRIGSGSAQEIVEGIENMQILYGVDTDVDGAANYYVTADVVPDWTQVVSVRISLLAATIDNNLTDQPLPYTWNGATITPTDRKIRRVFNTTLAVRNRLP